MHWSTEIPGEKKRRKKNTDFSDMEKAKTCKKYIHYSTAV